MGDPARGDLLFFAEDVADANEGIGLFFAEPRQQVLPDRFGVDGARCLQLLASVLGEHDENDTLFGLAAFDELSLLHSREVMGEAALVPAQTFGEVLLAHLAFPESGEAGENSEVWSREAGGFRDVAAYAIQYVVPHHSEGVPDTELLRGQQFGGHPDKKSIRSTVDITT